MKINQLVVENFRIYHKVNILDFSPSAKKNVCIVSGNNGFGKTTLLTSMVWCLYGKLMVDVDDRYRREIYEAGGYRRYCEKILNSKSRSTSKNQNTPLDPSFDHDSSSATNSHNQDLENTRSFSVSILISDIFIPSIPCKEVKISRTYNIETQKETVNIFIDGRENELTREVGPEIFISDFILPKEIAKFFFFDAEKIVSLAEISSPGDKRTLSRAYAEVLGIKKYVDLRDNLENLRARLKRNSATQKDKVKLNELTKEYEQNQKLIQHYDEKTLELEDISSKKKRFSDSYQEKLIREGSSITVDELNDLKALAEHLGDEAKKIRQSIKQLIELAPFAIAANKLLEVQKQIEQEQTQSLKISSRDYLKHRVASIKAELKTKRTELGLTLKSEKYITHLIEERLKVLPEGKVIKQLLDFDRTEQNQFYALFDNLQDSYSRNFRLLTKDLKKNQSAYATIVNKLSNAESKEQDPVIQELRKDKSRIDEDINQLQEDIIELKAKKLSLQHEMAAQSRVISELNKKITVAEIDKNKDILALELISELDEFISKLKKKKKVALEDRLRTEINRLLHKNNFVKKVEVTIEGDLIDIELYNQRDEVISKNELSMGERQLYATALLKALVDESNVRFPIFIDSPLQKFDRKHSENVIKEFYPTVSDQVVLFPLLDGELTEKEYQWLLPMISNSYLIENIDSECSHFRAVRPSDLFSEYNHLNAYV